MMTNDYEQLTTEVLSLTGNAERVTNRVREVIELAIKAAERSSSRTLDSGHLLSGLISEGMGVAAHVLQAVRLQPAELDRLLTDAASGHNVETAAQLTIAKLTIDDELKLAIGDSWNLAVSMNHNFIGTEHLLLAIVSQKSRARDLLAQLGIEGELVATKIRELIQRSQLAR